MMQWKTSRGGGWRAFSNSFTGVGTSPPSSYTFVRLCNNKVRRSLSFHRSMLPNPYRNGIFFFSLLTFFRATSWFSRQHRDFFVIFVANVGNDFWRLLLLPWVVTRRTSRGAAEVGARAMVENLFRCVFPHLHFCPGVLRKMTRRSERGREEKITTEITIPAAAATVERRRRIRWAK